MLLSVLIPCYNEQDSVGDVLVRLEQVDIPMPSEVIVIDDGSSDASPDIVSSHSSVRLIRHQRNLGKGAAIRTGIRESRGDVLLIQDADMEYFPEDIPGLLRPLLRNEADFVLGSRIIGTRRGMSLTHLVGNLFLSLAVTILFAKLVTDLATGYKVFRREVLQECAPSSSDFEMDAEIVAKALKKGYRMREVPIHYEYRRTGVSKIRLKHGIVSLLQIFRVRASSLRGDIGRSSS